MDCEGVPKEICQAWQAGFDEGFVAGQREGASVALHTDTIQVWRREPPPADLVVMWSGLFLIAGLVLGRLFFGARR